MLKGFTNVQGIGINPERTLQTGIEDLQRLQVGSSQNTFKVDRQGMWLGSDRFENAPFKVDMNGNIFLSVSPTTGVSPRITMSDEDGNVRFLLET